MFKSDLSFVHIFAVLYAMPCYLGLCLIVSCRMSIIHVREDNDSNVQVMNMIPQYNV